MHPLTPVLASLPRLVPNAHDFVEGFEGAVRRAKQELQAAQNRMAQRVNAHCRELKFNPGDLVLLSTKNLRQPGPGVRKLQPSYMGPFEVDSTGCNVAVKLNLPREWTRIHNVFHVNLVKPCSQGSGDQPSRQYTKPPAPLQFLDGEPLFEVEALLDHELVTFSRGKGRNKKPKAFYRFLIKWANYTEDDNKWEPEEGLLTCDDMIREYKAKNGLAEKAIDMVNA
jgi:hypothetical protein